MDATPTGEDEYPLPDTKIPPPITGMPVNTFSTEEVKGSNSPTTFDLPIRSFLEAYQHPAFVLEAQALFESLIQRLSIWRNSDPEEPIYDNIHMAQGLRNELVGMERKDQPKRDVGADENVGGGSGVSNRGGSVETLVSVQGSPPRTLSDDDGTIGFAGQTEPPNVSIFDSATLQPGQHHHPTTPHDIVVDNILSEAFAPQHVPLASELLPPAPFHMSQNVIMDSLSEIPATETAGYYPYVVGKAADVGWNHTLRSLLKPLWANAAWYDLLHAMNLTTVLGSDDSILELLSISDAKALTTFLRSVVGAAGGIALDPDTPPLRSVQLELVSRNVGDAGYLHATPSISGNTEDLASMAGTGEIRVRIELVATMVDSTKVVTIPPGQHPLAGQYLVITSILSNLPPPRSLVSHSKDIFLGPNEHPVLATTTSDEDLALPYTSASLPALQVPTGFILEDQQTRGNQGRRLLSRGGVSTVTLSDDDADELDTPSEKPDSTMMEWAGPMDKPSRDTSQGAAQSDWIAKNLLETDPFCVFLTTLPMGRLILAFPWHTTPLGPLVTWSGDLKSLISVMLASPFRESLWVGPEGVMLYNDAYIKTASHKHPWLLGKSAAIGWAEIWETLEPSIRRARRGETIAAYDNLLFLDRAHNDPLGIRREETYHIWAMIPSRGSSGEVIAMMSPSFETTSRVLAERRLGTLRDLVLTLSLTRTNEEFFTSVLTSLSRNPCDLPFVICYSCKIVEPKQQRPGPKKPGRDPIEKPEPKSLHLEFQGGLGIPSGHASAPAEINLIILDPPSESSDLGSQWESVSSTGSNVTTKDSFHPDKQLPWPLQEACSTCKPVFIPDLGARHAGFEQRGWDENPRAAVVIPITTDGSTPQAVLIVGLNPRRPFNEAYANWLQLIAKQLATHIAIIKGYSDEVAKTHQLAQLDRAKTVFFSNVNHELRTPLTLILGPLDDILADQESYPLTSEVRERLKIASRNAHRLLNLVNSLLDFSRLEAGRMHAIFRPVDLSVVTSDLASLFRSAIKKGKIHYEVRVPKEKVEVWLDLDLWEKVVFNIIGNAFKYCLAGSIEVRVTKGSHFAEFSVTDTGCGIAESELGQIFERFHRIESTSRSQEGTGIGLSLTLEIVKLLGGTMDVQSIIDEGTTFYLRLPYGNAHLSAHQLSAGTEDAIAEGVPRKPQNMSIVEEASRWMTDRSIASSGSAAGSAGESDSAIDPAVSATSDVGSSSGSGSDPNTGSGSDGISTDDALSIRNSVILLADDNTDMRNYCRSILSKKFVVIDVADGQAALDYARQYSPDLIVTDIMMPRLGGYGLLKALREDSATQLIPVILLSARAGTEARVDGLSAGADDYLAKPFSSKEFLARATTHLQLGKMRRELEKQVQERTRALVESEIRYRNLAEEYSTVTNVSPVGIFALDAEGSTRFVNPPWHVISGHSQDLPLDDWPKSVHPDDRVDLIAKFHHILQEPQPLTAVFRWLHGDHTQCDIRPQYDADYNLTGWVGSLTNIQERHRLETLHLHAVEQRATDAEEMRRQQELFIDITSHEMRNLNSGIYNSADLVAGSLKKMQKIAQDMEQDNRISSTTLLSALEQDREAVENIMLCSSAQSRIADDILRYSKLSMGLLSISKSDFHLVNRISEVIAMFSLESAQKQIQLSLSVEPGVAAHKMEWINADPHRLSQVLINFLTNALRFTVTSSLKTIVVRTDVSMVIPEKSPTAMRVGDYNNAEDALWLTCSVVDSGRGLSPDDRAKLFERFAQANPKTDGVGGYGLGLFVSRKIVELHHGFITVESQEGAGSTFSFSVPVTKADHPIDPASASNTKMSTTSLPVPPTITSPGSFMPTQAVVPQLDTILQGGHILIVEDNAINTKVLVRQLTNSGFTTTTAENGQIALDILVAREGDKTKPKIDVVLMDVEMPVCDGLTAIRMIREYEASGRLTRKKVIAVTGNARQEQLDVCRGAGFQHGIAIKPYRLPELLSMIQEARLTP